jgi:ADP-ribose pyrophosphatase YjhB (NUDIX family)
VFGHTRGNWPVKNVSVIENSQQHPHAALPELWPLPDGHRRCAACQRVIYSEPKLAAAAIIPFQQGIVLIKRGIEPAYGRWSFPSGYVNRGEVIERAVEREVMEETGLRVTAKWLVGLYSSPGSPVALGVYHADVRGGELTAADEALEASVFSISCLPELAFEHDAQIVSDWLAALVMRGMPAP